MQHHVYAPKTISSPRDNQPHSPTNTPRSNIQHASRTLEQAFQPQKR